MALAKSGARGLRFNERTRMNLKTLSCRVRWCLKRRKHVSVHGLAASITSAAQIYFYVASTEKREKDEGPARTGRAREKNTAG